ncbi:N-acetylmuramoyl-L-alanine amidase [Terrihabitans sp. B22-R8]|uniref:N-acetylmuramoyl-L-alanine amidase n=1 Tax=Terrihabitans sp. B22-R8 TaxID=3425128 RepID=UPI00403C08C2
MIVRFVQFVLLMGCLLIPSGAVLSAEPIVAQAARLEGDDARTTLVVDLAARVEPQTFTLASPYRVVVDLPDVVFNTASSVPQQNAKGLVSAYRYGLIAPGRSRVVLDSEKPLGIDRVRVEELESGGARVSLDLVAISHVAFMKNAARARSDNERVPAEKVEPAEGREAHKPLIAIDPGHGGIDPGARSRTGEHEKDVVLAFARTLKQRLLATGRYRVLMTRDTDTFIALGQRVRMARDNQANLFLSIHADSISDTAGVRGATIYTLSERASDREAERLAEKENKADLIAGVDLTEEPDEVAGILIDLAHRETKVFSSRFAKTLHGSIDGAMRLNNNPLRSAGFTVLRAPDVPSALLELGYMSSKDDIKLLTSQSWRERASQAVVRAVDDFFGSSSSRAN